MTKEKEPLTIQCDEMWSFVANKKNKQWIWLALDIETKEIVGVYVGNRSRDAAEKLWRLPTFYQQGAVCYTDFRSAYNQIFPKSRHQNACPTEVVSDENTAIVRLETSWGYKSIPSATEDPMIWI